MLLHDVVGSQKEIFGKEKLAHDLVNAIVQSQDV